MFSLYVYCILKEQIIRAFEGSRNSLLSRYRKLDEEEEKYVHPWRIDTRIAGCRIVYINEMLISRFNHEMSEE